MAELSELAINRSKVRFLAAAISGSANSFTHTHVPLSPSSIIWYRPKVGDALRLGR